MDEGEKGDPVQIDTTSEFGARVARRLEDEQVVWLTTVGADGTPQPSPVWFLWDGETVLIYSQPNTPKVRNVARNPRVSLAFNATFHGGDVVVLTGDARIDDGAPAAHAIPEYVAKYAEGLTSLGMSAEAFATEYATPIRVRPKKLRGF